MLIVLLTTALNKLSLFYTVNVDNMNCPQNRIFWDNWSGFLHCRCTSCHASNCVKARTSSTHCWSTWLDSWGKGQPAQ